jgi:hypothetical protein
MFVLPSRISRCCEGRGEHAAQSRARVDPNERRSTHHRPAMPGHPVVLLPPELVRFASVMLRLDLDCRPSTLGPSTDLRLPTDHRLPTDRERAGSCHGVAFVRGALPVLKLFEQSTRRRCCPLRRRHLYHHCRRRPIAGEGTTGPVPPSPGNGPKDGPVPAPEPHPELELSRRVSRCEAVLRRPAAVPGPLLLAEAGAATATTKT